MSSPHPLQEAIRNYLLEHDWFKHPRPIPIFTRDEGDLQNRILAALGSLDGGLAVLVTVPSGMNNSPESAAVRLDSQVFIECFELPLVSRAPGGIGKTAYGAARLLERPHSGPNKGLHGWLPPGEGYRLRATGYVSESNPESGGLLVVASFKFIETLI